MKKNKNSYSLNQLSGLVSLIIVTVWSLVIFYMNIARPLGMDFIEIQFLAALIPAWLVLVFLYGFRIRWAYISGIIALLGLFVGLTKSLIDKTFFFSFTAYNLIALIVLAIALICIYFSNTI